LLYTCFNIKYFVDIILNKHSNFILILSKLIVQTIKQTNNFCQNPSNFEIWESYRLMWESKWVSGIIWQERFFHICFRWLNAAVMIWQCRCQFHGHSYRWCSLIWLRKHNHHLRMQIRLCCGLLKKNYVLLDTALLPYKRINLKDSHCDKAWKGCFDSSDIIDVWVQCWC